MSAEGAGSVVLLLLALVVLATALALLNLAIGAARQERQRAQAKGMPRRLWPHTHAVYLDMRGVQPYVVREALYRAGVHVYGVQPPALERAE